MCKENRKRNPGLVICIAIGLLSACISVPERPLADKVDCIGKFPEMRRQVTEIQHDNWGIQSAIFFVSYGFAIFLGTPVLLVPVVAMPVQQIRSKSKTDELIDPWVRVCQEAPDED